MELPNAYHCLLLAIAEMMVPLERCQLNSLAREEGSSSAFQAAAVASVHASFAALRKVRRVSRLIR